MSRYIPPDLVPGANPRFGVELSGRDRFKYFKRPVVASGSESNQTLASQYMQTRAQIGTNITRTGTQRVQSIQPMNVLGLNAAKKSTRENRIPHSLTRSPAETIEKQGKVSVMCQTDYRENECQTDPYSPPYDVEEGAQLEVMVLSELKYGAGLPAGLAEVEMIDRIRRRRAIEAVLPQGNDDVSMQKRLQALETLEHQEWAEREEHIKRLQDDRLQNMKRALQKREEQRESSTMERLHRAKLGKEALMDQKIEQLQRNRQKIARKISKELSGIRVNLDRTSGPPSSGPVNEDIIESHVFFGRRGTSVRSNALIEKNISSNYDVRPTLLGFVEGIQELERTQMPRLETVRPDRLFPPPEPTLMKLKSNFQRRIERTITSDLEHAHETILKKKGSMGSDGALKSKSVQELYRATPRLNRPGTPTLVLQGDVAEEKESAAVLLQRLLRGRAMQNEFFEGRERCHGLILELQAAQKAKEEICEIKADRFVAMHQKVRCTVRSAIAEVISKTFDYLAKELIQQREIARIEIYRKRIRLERSKREEEEHKLRVQETVQRYIEDYQYQSILEVHRGSATTLIEQTMEYNIKARARERASANNFKELPIRHVSSSPDTQSEADEIDVATFLNDVVLTNVDRRIRGEVGPRCGAYVDTVARVSVAYEGAMYAIRNALSINK